MAAFRPCEWNENRSSKTRGTECSGKKYWPNQNSKGKCLMNVTLAESLGEVLSLFESKILANDPTLSIWWNTYTQNVY